MTHLAEDKQRVVWTLPHLSQECQEGPITAVNRGRVEVRYDFETDTGEYAWDSFAFAGVEAFEFTSHDSCSAEQIAAYDKLVEVEASEWLGTLRGAETKFLRHFRIYFDEWGAFDVAAEDVSSPSASVNDPESGPEVF